MEGEHGCRLGPGPFILAARANKLAAVSLDHEFVAELANVLGCVVLVGVRVGDAIVFTDLVGDESPSLTFVAPTPVARSIQVRPERPCSQTSPTTRCTAFSISRAPSRRARSDNSSPSFPDIRLRRLAFNRGVTFEDAFAVATPLLAPDGSLIAAISAAVDALASGPSRRHRWRAQDALPPWARNTGSTRAETGGTARLRDSPNRKQRKAKSSA